MANPTSITATRQASDVHGNQKVTTTRVVGAASYATGGDALTAAQLGLQVVQAAQCDLVACAATNTVAVADYDIANAKLKYFTLTGELANAASAANVTVQVTAWGY